MGLPPHTPPSGRPLDRVFSPKSPRGLRPHSRRPGPGRGGGNGFFGPPSYPDRSRNSAGSRCLETSETFSCLQSGRERNPKVTPNFSSFRLFELRFFIERIPFAQYPEWAEELRDHCRKQGVAFFLKQLGRNPTRGELPIKLKDKHGGNWEEWEKSLRVREFPRAFTEYRKNEMKFSDKPRPVKKSNKS
jgi:hypothetical protein